MRTYQEFITEIRRFRLRRSGGDPFTRYSDGKQKPIDLSAIHAAGNADAKASVGYKEKRLKQYRRQETARRMDAAGKKLGLPEEVEIEEGIGMTVASALGNPPLLSKRMKLKQALIINKIKSDSEKNKKKKYSGKAVSQKEEYENIDELFITRKSPEERADAKRKKKVETLIRLMKHAKDPSADVAKTKKEDYELDETIRNPESRKKLRAIMDREVEKGDKSKGQNPRRKYLTKKGDQAFGLLMSRDETGSKNNPVRKRGGTNAPADERVGKGPHRAGNAAYWASVAGPTRDRGAGNKAARRAGKSVPNTRDDD